LTTRLYFVDESCVGYGHLDFEEKFWLGICVSDSERGKKYGDFILKDILSTTNECIYLTVDILNIIAQNLYKKHGFEVENIFENIILMKKKHN
jgi:ribosomal protein S18 acetylase RimI-like enzyme